MPSSIRGTLPLPVRRILKKLGSDIRDARLRRRIRASTMAERALISRTTLHKIERGDAGVSMGMYATVLFVLGMHDGISELADRSRDGIGLDLLEERLPQRVRVPSAARRNGRHASSGRRRPGRGMMDTPVLVHVDLRGVPIRVGRLWIRVRGGRESASFEYDAAWTDHPLRFALEPALTVGPGPYHTRGRLFGSIGDSAPDRWGRVLLRRAEVRQARSEGRAPRTLFESDFLLRVDDEVRMGALRFSTRGEGPFLAEAGAVRVPPLADLRRLMAASRRALRRREQDDDLRLLVGPGSSLGGSRPKAAVRDAGGELALAKFPSTEDDRDIVLWEGVALALAKRAGLQVPAWRLETVAGRRILILRRFDRERGHRVPFLSAMSMLDARDNERRSYLELADALRSHGRRRDPTSPNCGDASSSASSSRTPTIICGTTDSSTRSGRAGDSHRPTI